MSQSTRLEISIDRQTLDLYTNGLHSRTFQVSTSEKGMGFTEGSLRTPTGRFVISQKIGDGEALYTKFNARVPIGLWDHEEKSNEDLILTRILRLEGIDPENANTLDRYIYIHGTNREDLIGIPSSHGCIRLPQSEYDRAVRRRWDRNRGSNTSSTECKTKLLFLDCDSTLSSIEGIDELARLSDPAIFAEVVTLTNAAMNGEVPLREVFPS